MGGSSAANLTTLLSLPAAHADDPAQLDQLAAGVKDLLTSETWEHKIGGLMSAKV